MAKTPEEKEAKRIATNERNRAFSGRRREYNAELDLARKAAQQNTAYQNSINASANMESVLSARDEEAKEIDRQIAELQEKRKALTPKYSDKLDDLRKVRDDNRKVYDEELRVKEDAINARFPDMVGCWSAAAWKRPEGV